MLIQQAWGPKFNLWDQHKILKYPQQRSYVFFEDKNIHQIHVQAQTMQFYVMVTNTLNLCIFNPSKERLTS